MKTPESSILRNYCNLLLLRLNKYKQDFQQNREKRRIAAIEEEKRRIEEEEKFRRTQYTEAKEYFNIITSKYLFIDSNIWMNKKYDILLRVIYSYCKRNHSSVLIPGSQLDELDRLAHSDAEGERLLAQRALKKIEYFQLNGIIKTAGVQAGMQFDSSYADPSFIEFFLKELQINGFSESVLLTDDRALRIRLNAMTIQQHNCLIKVFTGEKLSSDALDLYLYETRKGIWKY